ncbi:MAG: reverse transcriptase family protein, partial [Sulfurovum sp.]|nr:reverse transcriptase family protein [Sulfurovum sp.]
KDNDNLLAFHRVLNREFQKVIPLNNAAVAFRKNKSYLDLFEPHRKNYYFLRLDIKAFFHSIQIDDIKKTFSTYFEDEYIDNDKTQTLIDAFINLVTYKVPDNSFNEDFRGKQILPMGFVTSPVISNIIFRKIDIQIQKFCSKRDITYTRYADDMLFSSDKNSNYVHSDGFINEISILVAQLKFKLNHHKTLKATHTLSLNGYTIQYSNIKKDILGARDEEVISEFRLSNKKINIIKKMIHLIEVEHQTPQYVLKKLFNYRLPNDVPAEKKEEYYKHQITNKLTGYRSYILSFITFDKKYHCMQKNIVEKYIKLIKLINQNPYLQ